MARKLDEIGFTIFAGFTKRTGCADADLLKEESSGRTKILQLDVTSETQVKKNIHVYLCPPYTDKEIEAHERTHEKSE